MNKFVICLDNHGNPGSLIVGKVYRTLVDRSADAHGMIRVVDEDSTEPDGYLYPISQFAPIDVPAAAERVLVVSP